MTYQPKPVETSDVVLPPTLVLLTERLAANAHEVWARQRLRGGWVWGPARDDALKQHPSLVPYETLSESEREVDRQVVTETVKTMIALGYRILPGNS